MTNTRYSNDSKRKTYNRNVILIEICEEKNIVDSRKETGFEIVIRVKFMCFQLFVILYLMIVIFV